MPSKIEKFHPNIFIISEVVTSKITLRTKKCFELKWISWNFCCISVIYAVISNNLYVITESQSICLSKSEDIFAIYSLLWELWLRENAYPNLGGFIANSYYCEFLAITLLASELSEYNFYQLNSTCFSFKIRKQDIKRGIILEKMAWIICRLIGFFLNLEIRIFLVISLQFGKLSIYNLH